MAHQFQHWIDDLFSPAQGMRKPGNLGDKIPYLAIIRVLITSGMILRFAVSSFPEHASPVTLLLVAMVIVLALAESIFLGLEPQVLDRPRIAVFFIILEIAYISIAYALTGTIHSDFFLFYFLPIAMAADFGSHNMVRSTTLAVTLSFTAVLVFLVANQHPPMLNRLQLGAGVFVPRMVFFICVAVTIRFLILTEKNQNQRVLERHRMMVSLLRFGGELDAAFRPDLILELAAKTVGKELGLDSCQITTVPALSAAPTTYGHVQQPIAYVREIHAGTLEQSATFRVCSKCEFQEGIEDFVRLVWNRVRSALQRSQRVAVLRQITIQAGSALDLSRHLNEVLDQVVNVFKLEFATVSLVDRYVGSIRCVSGRNVSPGWIRRSRQELESSDVQSHVARTGEVMELEGGEGLALGLFNRDVYERFHHERVARIWVPLRASDGQVIGTIQCGCAIGRRSDLITSETRRGLEQLGVTKGRDVAATMPQVLLESIARNAFKMIGARAASIHVFEAKGATDEELAALSAEQLAERCNYQSPIMAAGAGFDGGAEAVRNFQPRPDGVGWRTICSLLAGSDQPFTVLNTPGQVQAHNTRLYGLGVRAMAVFPFSVSPAVKGMLYVHFFEPGGRFDDADLELERVFASQVETAIKNHLLFDQVALSIEQGRVYSQWLEIVQAPISGGSIGEVIGGLADNVLLASDADNIVIYRYDKAKGGFESPPILKGTFTDLPSLNQQVEPDHLVRTLDPHALPIFWKDVAGSAPPGSSSAKKKRFYEREFTKSAAVLALRARKEDELIGIMFLNFREQQSFDSVAQQTLQSLAQSAAIGIRTARYYEWIQRSQAEIDTLRKLDGNIVEHARTLLLGPVLESILERCRTVLKASAGAVFWRFGNQFRSVATHPRTLNTLVRELGEGLAGRFGGNVEGAAGSTDAGVIVSVESGHLPVENRSRSAIAVPLRDGTGVLGVLTLESELLNAFSEHDLRWLQTLGLQAVLAHHTAESYKGLQKQLRQASALADVAQALQQPDLELEGMLRIVLTGITAGSGLGFSRAMLFRSDEGGRQLTGWVGVGEITYEAADRRWLEIAPPGTTENFSALLKSAARTSVHRELEDAVRRIRFSITSSPDVEKCIRDRQPVRMTSLDPLGKRVQEKTKDEAHSNPMACMPLLSGQVLGLLVVDNRFLPHQANPIDEEAIVGLTAFANLAAMAIDNFQLRQKSQIEGYRNWVHEIKSPLLLAKQVADNALAELEPRDLARPYLEKLLALAQKTLRVGRNLQFFVDMARGGDLTCRPERATPEGIVTLIERSVEQFHLLYPSAAFHIESESFDCLMIHTVEIDPGLLELMLDCLFDNAAKYGGKETQVRVQSIITQNGNFSLRVSNVGSAISSEDAARAAERHFRGDSAQNSTDEGSGIGLWIVGSVMRAHGGKFHLDPTTSDGITTANLVFCGKV